MKLIADLVVRVADLVEAEGRTFLVVLRREAGHLHHVIGRFSASIGALAAGLVLFVAGWFWISFGIMDWMNERFGKPSGGVTVGLATMLLAAGCFMFFAKGFEKKNSP